MPNPTLGTGLKVNARYIHIVVSFPTHTKKIRLRFSVHEPGCIKHLALTVALTGMVSTDRMPVILLERIAWTIGQLLMLCTVQVVLLYINDIKNGTYDILWNHVHNSFVPC
jgi:hypothetical protein